MEQVMEGTERRERGQGSGKERAQKGRLVQERDRRALAWIGVNRVVREQSLAKVVFPGRDSATIGNRLWELARDIEPTGPFLRVHRRTLDDGRIERYLSLADAGYFQAEKVLGPRWFHRKPDGDLKPSHVAHDLDLADLALSLMPTRTEEYLRLIHGRPAGPPQVVAVPYLPRKWRWYHASVFRRLTVFDGAKNADGRPIEKPKVVLAFDPDAVLETDAADCVRIFIEYDRGTEAIVGEKATRTILDKLRRIRRYFLESSTPTRAHAHWSERMSHYVAAFPGGEMRSPRILFITTSPVRARNIQALASRFFAPELDAPSLAAFFEVRTVADARVHLKTLCERVEQAADPVQMPWYAEIRELRTREAQARAETEKAARERAQRIEERLRRDPNWVPYRFTEQAPHVHGYEFSAEEATLLLGWTDQIRAHDRVPDYESVGASMFKLLARIRAAVRPTFAQRAGTLLNAQKGPDADALVLKNHEDNVLFHWIGDVLAWRRRYPDVTADETVERGMAALVAKILSYYRTKPDHTAGVIPWIKSLLPADSPWNAPARET